jgi:hypothetical protein
MSSAAFSNILQYIIGGISFLPILKLWYTGLYKRYVALFSFLLFSLVYSLSVLVLFRDYRSQAYQTYWEICQPLTWLFSVWVVLELYSLILERHKGLATFGRWIQYAGFTISTAVSLLVMLPQVKAGANGAGAVALYYYPIERGVDCGMLVFLLFILVWLTQYPVPLSRNVVVHSFAYTALFFANSFGLLAQMFFGLQLSLVLTILLDGVLVACSLAWLLLLTPKGEEIRVRVPQFSAEHEARVLEHLEALNRTLLEISKK